MQNFWKSFNEKYTKTVNKAKVNEMHFIWEFFGFPEIVNINNFFVYIEHKLKINLTKNQEDDYREKISQLRDLFEMDFTYFTNNSYVATNYLIKSYTLVRDFINEALFVYVWYTFKHEEILFKHQMCDIDEFYEFKFIKLEEQFEKLKKTTHKSLIEKTT